MTHDSEQETWNDFKLDAEFRVAKSWLISPTTTNPLGRSTVSTGVTTMNTNGQLPEIVVSQFDEGPDPRDVQLATANCDVSGICQVIIFRELDRVVKIIEFRHCLMIQYGVHVEA